MSGKIEISRELAEKLARNLASGEEAYSAMGEICRILAAPVVERQPVSADIVRDKAYRNGMMAGFSFGIRGDEDGYAKAVERYDAEIHAAKAEQTAPVAVVLPTILSSEQGPHYSDNRTSELGYLAGYNACLDKVKELNQ